MNRRSKDERNTQEKLIYTTARCVDCEGPHRRGGAGVDEGRLQVAPGGGGGLQRQSEEQARLSAADLAGIGERLYPCESRPDGGLRGGYRRLPHREAGAPSERGLLRLRKGRDWTSWVSGCHLPGGVGGSGGRLPYLVRCLRRVVVVSWFTLERMKASW